MTPAMLALAATITLFYNSNNTVQKVVDHEVCAAGRKQYGPLMAKDSARVIEINQALLVAYEESGGSDAQVEAVRVEFCEAAGER